MCVAVNKQCPNNCFYHGACAFMSVRSGLPLSPDDCSVLNTDCKPVCNCISGYVGSYCSYNTTALATKKRVRESLLDALFQLTELQDANEPSFQSWITSLRSITSIADEVSLLAANVTNLLLVKLLGTGKDLDVAYEAVLPLFGVCSQVTSAVSLDSGEHSPFYYNSSL